MTGLGIDTLRAWERRYGVVAPARGDRGRRYSQKDVTRLSRLAELVQTGHPIGSVAALSDAALDRLLRAGGADPRVSQPELDLAPVMTAIRRYDVGALESWLNRHAVVLPPSELIFRVVLPLMHETGERWECGAMLAAQEHVLSAAVRSVLGGLLRTMPRAGRARPMLFATLQGERHELGLLAAAVLAAQSGTPAIYLGPDLPASEIARAAAGANARTVVLANTSVLRLDTAEARHLQKLPPGMQLWIGGPGAARIKQSIGARARSLDSLQEFERLTDRG